MPTKTELQEQLTELQRKQQEIDSKKVQIKASLIEIRNQELFEHERLVIQHIDALLAFVQEHNYNGCSDADPKNYYDGACTRCVLLKAKEMGAFWDSGIISVTFTIER